MKQILISGANRGIGLELARQLLARGQKVYAGCRDPQGAGALQELAERLPDRLSIVPLDVTDEESLDQARAIVGNQTGHLDWLVNNAGILIPGERLEPFDASVMQRTMDVNVTGVLRLTSRFVDLLRGASQGKLVNISSDAGSLSKPHADQLYSYNASKAALNMVTRLLAQQLYDQQIIVVALHPGWVHTDMGGQEAPVSPQESAVGMIRLVDSLTLAETDKFFTFRGNEYPW